jgi:hypothetical protein
MLGSLYASFRASRCAPRKSYLKLSLCPVPGKTKDLISVLLVHIVIAAVVEPIVTAGEESENPKFRPENFENDVVATKNRLASTSPKSFSSDSGSKIFFWLTRTLSNVHAFEIDPGMEAPEVTKVLIWILTKVLWIYLQATPVELNHVDLSPELKSLIRKEKSWIPKFCPCIVALSGQNIG